ncbi:MAG: hypothetical protein A4E53_01943 [Pelotomaculum sp. PtaB.Bin104]|nr:MAG: hypothetical protein A4E53_01943 [Pelotomaculum sp. PtaB.Bin104]
MIFFIISINGGIVLFLFGFKEYRRLSFGKNLIEAIISAFTDTFEFSSIGMMLIGLILIVIGIIGLLK